MGPHVHVNWRAALPVVLVVIAFFGSAHLAALSAPNTKASQVWLALGF